MANQWGKRVFCLLIVGMISGCVPPSSVYRYDPPPMVEDWTGPEPEVEPEQAATATVKAEAFQSHTFQLNAKDSLVGQLAVVTPRDGDTLLDIARHYGVGYEHIVAANPGVDIWVPQDRKSTRLNSSH